MRSQTPASTTGVGRAEVDGMATALTRRPKLVVGAGVNRVSPVVSTYHRGRAREIAVAALTADVRTDPAALKPASIARRGSADSIPNFSGRQTCRVAG